MVSHWSLGDSQSLQVYRTLLSILADLNNAVVWMVSTRLLISKSSSRCNNPLVTVKRAPITIGIIVIFMFLSFSNPWQGWCEFIFLFVFFQFYSVVNRDNKVHNSSGSLFYWFLQSGRQSIGEQSGRRHVCQEARQTPGWGTGSVLNLPCKKQGYEYVFLNVVQQ